MRNGEREGPNGAAVAVRSLRRVFGTTVAVDDVSLDIKPGEFLALLGPSGSGKSTVLMSIAGFDRPNGGQILVDGTDCIGMPVNRRNIGMVFQNYTLFPHMSVTDNVAFPLKMRGVGRSERRARAERALGSVHLAGFGARMPHQLSGGQQQRVALARAIVYRPRLLLMDEPFSALDRKLRDEMRLETKRLHAELGVTIVFVTHDQEEALTMADRVAVLSGGRVQQIGPSRELYERPANLFVAGFMGDMNLVPVVLDGSDVVLPSGARWHVPQEHVLGERRAGSGTLAVRPERFSLPPRSDDLTLTARISAVIYSGADTLLVARLTDGTEVRIRRTSTGDDPVPEVGAEVAFGCAPDAVLVYPGGER